MTVEEVLRHQADAAAAAQAAAQAAQQVPEQGNGADDGHEKVPPVPISAPLKDKERKTVPCKGDSS